MNGRCQDINPLLFLIHHVISLTPNTNQSTSSAPYMSEAPHYVMFHNIIIHNLKPTSPSPLQPSSHPAGKNSFPAKLSQVAILTHTRARAGPQDGFGSRQADPTRTSFRLRQQLAPWSSTSGSKVLFRFSYQIQFKNQLLKFSLSSKTRLISLYDNMQTNFPSAFLSGSNLGAAAKRISSLICYHAKPLVKLFIKVTYA